MPADQINHIDKPKVILAILLLVLGLSDTEARSKSRSTAHKQIDNIDPHSGDHWLSQINVEVDRYSDADYLYSSITTSKNNWSFQFGGQNIPITASSQIVPLLHAGVVKQFDINSWLNFTLGSQFGSYAHAFTFTNFDYATIGVNQYDLSLAIGPYYANKELTETFSKIGYIVSWNYSLQQFTVNGSYISGSHNMSGLSANLGYNINKYVQPYLGFGDVAPNLSCEKCSQYYYMALGLNLIF